MADDQPGLRPLDVATLAYVLVEAAVVVVFLRHRPVWPYLLMIYMTAAAMTVLFASVRASGRFWRAFRLTYPLLIVVILYEALNHQVFIFHSRPLDATINSAEMTILGFDSSFALQRFMSVPLNEIMSFFYISYYFIPPVVLLVFLFHEKWRVLERSVLAASITFYICYAIFIIFPVVGPRLYLKSIYYLPLMGPLFTPLAQRIVAAGGLHGGAMPSSHCGVALVMIWFFSREFRRFEIPFYAMLLMLCVSTVYGRYHYSSDVVIGLLVGTLSIGLTYRWQNGFLARRESAADMPGAEIENTIRAGIDA